MNIFQRLIALWGRLWGMASGLGPLLIVPLPPPVMSPAVPAADLIVEAEARGVADARAAMLNSWSFGGPTDAESDRFDPDYVCGLRHRRAAAIASLQTAQLLTDERLAPARVRRDESRDLMADARARMCGLATRDELAQERAFAAAPLDPAAPPDPAAPLDPGVHPDPAVDPDSVPASQETTPWEGETMPLRLGWRLLILIGLVAAELPVQLYVFGYFLAPHTGALAGWLALATGTIIVFGPFVAGMVLRTRPATGTDRRIGYAAIVFSVGWLFAIAVLGIIRGRLFRVRAGAGAVYVSLVTIVLMFVALLLVVGAMSMMLGLARRHPFQEAYVRHRMRRDRYETLIQTTAAQLNPAYLDPGQNGTGHNGTQSPQAQQQAIHEAYAAAENAYFAALSRTVGDPAFTEAVQHRRGLRATS